MTDFTQARRMMVDCQVRTYDVTDNAVLAALGEVPRERFVPAGREALAYSDQAIALSSASPGGGRVLLAPMLLARLIQALDVSGGDKVLDVGCGTGYSTAVLAHMGARVCALEPDGQLAARARAILAELGGAAAAATVAEGPAAAGQAGASPYDAILVNGRFEIRPEGLLGQLDDNGRLAGIEGSGLATKAVLYRRAGGAVSRQVLFDATAPAFDDLRKTTEFVW
jgi:protein-L-isoaspartate(D-aspartate) O-methyltransferase